jgi:hypothetical protein
VTFERSSSGRRTYYTILKLADHALLKMVRYVLLRPLRPELDGRPSFSWSNLRKHHQNQHNCRPLDWDIIASFASCSLHCCFLYIYCIFFTCFPFMYDELKFVLLKFCGKLCFISQLVSKLLLSSSIHLLPKQGPYTHCGPLGEHTIFTTVVNQTV